MLVTFSCQAYANVTYFGEIGKELLKLMGYPSSSSGSIAAEAIPAALERLSKQLGPDKDRPDHDANFHDEQVSIKKRALPLLELLKVAAEEKCNVWWETK